MWKRCGNRCVVPGVACIQKCCAFKTVELLLNIYVKILFMPARLRLLRELQVRKTIMMTKRNRGKRIQRLKGSTMSMMRMVRDIPGFLKIETCWSKLNWWSLLFHFFCFNPNQKLVMQWNHILVCYFRKRHGAGSSGCSRNGEWQWKQPQQSGQCQWPQECCHSSNCGLWSRLVNSILFIFLNLKNFFSFEFFNL